MTVQCLFWNECSVDHVWKATQSGHITNEFLPWIWDYCTVWRSLWRRLCCYISIIWPSHKSNDHCSTAPLLLLLQRHHIRAGFGFHFPVINFNNTIIMIIYERMYSFAVSAWVCVDMCLCRIDWLVWRTKYWDLCCMQNLSKPHIFIGSRKTLLLSIATSCQSSRIWWADDIIYFTGST